MHMGTLQESLAPDAGPALDSIQLGHPVDAQEHPALSQRCTDYLLQRRLSLGSVLRLLSHPHMHNGRYSFPAASLYMNPCTMTQCQCIRLWIIAQLRVEQSLSIHPSHQLGTCLQPWLTRLTMPSQPIACSATNPLKPACCAAAVHSLPAGGDTRSAHQGTIEGIRGPT